MIKILLVADFHLRAQAKQLLLADGKVHRIAEARSASDALSRCFAVPPDIAIVDSSAEADDVAWVAQMLARSVNVRILALANLDETALVRRALQAGAVGALTRDGISLCLAEAVAAVAAKRPYLEPTLAHRLAVAEFATARSPADVLSESEFDIFVRFAAGATVKQIASDLSSSAAAIGVQLRTVTRKLGAIQRYDLALIARRHGLMDQEHFVRRG